ncbi:ZIP family metal transporter [Metabacillus sediminilitoris]|uniref:ZIP family metal transporter n=1 Tax=Metabacillus sediminilitoris TaxID=2567941 RepID=A0A4S4C0A8_9BACI|nr:ZIP family metal transporter [Metabacillus sediminilitoris]QGQ47915.1 ZIP family metal transporter [Metabacillus sediminilitoris]THF80971.1 ZIP family metal transporter [Metabacillus sediminilitoris]
MLQSAFWGALAGSSILIGALIGLYTDLPKKVTGLIMSFGTGVLIGAASFELLTESIREDGVLTTSIGFLSGAFVFTISELFITKKGGNERKRTKKRSDNHSGLSIFIGTIIDAIPESVIIGVSLLEQGTVSYLMVIAVFLSNFPEGLSSTVGLKKDGYSKKTLLIMWLIVVLLASLSSLLGFSLLQDASTTLLSFISAFAAGGIMAMVASTMMPEAFEEGGAIVGLISSFGLLCSLILSQF